PGRRGFGIHGLGHGEADYRELADPDEQEQARPLTVVEAHRSATRIQAHKDSDHPNRGLLSKPVLRRGETPWALRSASSGIRTRTTSGAGASSPPSAVWRCDTRTRSRLRRARVVCWLTSVTRTIMVRCCIGG